MESLGHYPKLFYISDCGSNANSIETSFDLKRDNEKNAGVFTKKYTENDLYCNNDNMKSTYVIPSWQYNTMPKEQQNISSGISSRYLYSETECFSHSRNSNEETARNPIEDNIKEKCSIYSKQAFIDTPDRVSGELQKEIQEKICSDKTTYCRPVLNYYNQEFLYKTMEKNAKLRRLVTELVIARQKEKKMENWNNYIANLRKKHNIDAKVKCAHSLQNIFDELRTTATIEDIYKKKCTCNQSNPCQNLLQDFYKAHDIGSSYYDDYRTHNEYTRKSREYNPFKTNPLCFPTSSQGRFIMLERERMKHLKNREYKPLFRTIHEEKGLRSEGLKTTDRKGCGPEILSTVCNSRSTNITMDTTSPQTETERVDVVTMTGCHTNHVGYNKVCIEEICDKGTAPKNYSTDNNFKNRSLVCIEEKLDNLIYSINNFITEMKTKSAQHELYNQHSKLGKRNVNYTRSDGCNMARKEKTVCGSVDASSRTTGNSSIDNYSRIQTIDDNLTKINDILLKEIGKNKLITLKRSSVGDTYHPCSVEISVTIPTKEISTEVTRSLSKTGHLESRDIKMPRREDRCIAIAVNTDPLSLLALLRASTEGTIKRLLSYVPTVDYYSYLSRLQGPSPKIVDTHYVCNICGAAFTKPSALTDHIQKHELGSTRDCCTCRHVLDIPRRRPSLFKCQYCGQRFTRAYCCELHQEACARRLGKLHDVTSSLVLLR